MDSEQFLLRISIHGHASLFTIEKCKANIEFCLEMIRVLAPVLDHLRFSVAHTLIFSIKKSICNPFFSALREYPWSRLC